MNIPTKTTITIEFRIMGEEFDVEYVTNQLGIIPSKTWNKGDIIKDISKREYTCWMYIIENEGLLDAEGEESFDTNTPLLKLLNVFQEKEELLCMLKKKLSLSFSIEIVIKIVNDEDPAIYIEPDPIKFAANIGAKVNIHTYIY